jgi:small subunit ribosomal protein S17
MARVLTGVVSSNKGNKTIIITVATRKTHRLYKKQYTINTRFMAHDEDNEAKVGDRVEIIETRPLSAQKRFRLSKIIEKAGAGFEEADAVADIPQEPAKPETTEETAPKASKKAPAKTVKTPKSDPAEDDQTKAADKAPDEEAQP